MSAEVTQLYRETGTHPVSGHAIEVEALEWSADHHGTHYEINGWVRNKREDRTLQHSCWLLQHDNVVVKSRADIQRMAMREFDRLMDAGQPNGTEEDDDRELHDAHHPNGTGF